MHNLTIPVASNESGKGHFNSRWLLPHKKMIVATLSLLANDLPRVKNAIENTERYVMHTSWAK
jgi:hypothetical protein